MAENFLKYGKSHKSTDSRRCMNHKEIHIKADHSQTSVNKRQGNSLEISDIENNFPILEQKFK